MLVDSVWMRHVGVLLLWCAVLGLCTAERRPPRQTGRHGHAQSERRALEPWQQRARIPRKYCDPTNNQSAGSIIQSCGRGYYREGRHCVPCSCNGLANECDQLTGKCLNCKCNAAGDQCERCKEGYYGDPTKRTCQVCPCPLADLSNSFALGCLTVGKEVKCLCKPGYSGERCERCAFGYYGNPLAKRGSCQPCNCDYGHICDPLTGECEKTGGHGDCHECDSCIQDLLSNLERMDDELSRLKSELENVSSNSVSYARLKKLEEAIVATKDLVRKYNSIVQALRPKVVELETDIENVNEDLSKLEDMANATSSNAEKVLNDLDQTNRRGQNLISDTEDLLREIQELLDQLRGGNHTDVTVPIGEAARMLKEAQRMLKEMRRQNCRTQRELADKEQEEAHKLLDYIMSNLADPLNASQAEAGEIAMALMARHAQLRDLQRALEDAEGLVNQTGRLNQRNQEVLRDLLQKGMELEKEHGLISDGLKMAKGTLWGAADLLKMLEDGKKEYEELAAQLDGAKTILMNKLNKISVAEDVVRRAEKHAQDLSNLAMDFQMAVQNATNSSDVQNAIDAIKAYSDVINAIRDAEAAAKQAKDAANKALEDVKGQGLTGRAVELKNNASGLLARAKEAENDLKQASEDVNDQRKRLNQAKDKSDTLRRDAGAVIKELDSITRDDIGVLIDSAKKAVSAANSTVNYVTARLNNISSEVNKTTIPFANSDVDDLLNDAINALKNLTQTLPLLNETLAEVEKLSDLTPHRANMSDSIRRIKALIEETRDIANTAIVPMAFRGKGHVELRPPKDLNDLRAFTALKLSLQRPQPRGDQGGRRRRQGTLRDGNMFVLYLGSNDSSKDYVGMVLRNNVLFCIYKLGGIIHELEASEITTSSSSHTVFDNVDFRRVYQDAEVILTKKFSSKDPIPLPAKTYQANSTVTLLELGPADSVVFYVGGYPKKFTPPKELQRAKYRGCIEFSSFNDKLLSLYNFRHTVNINEERPCKRYTTQYVPKYFEGTGYAKILIPVYNPNKKNNAVQFSVLSPLENTLLFYIRNEDSRCIVSVEGGYVFMRLRQGDQTYVNQSDTKIFPVSTYYDFTVILGSPLKLIVKYLEKTVMSVSVQFTPVVYKDMYIGGIPTSLRERDNITYTPLRGCLRNLEMGKSLEFNEVAGIISGCRTDLLGAREASFKMGSSLTVQPKGLGSNAGVMVSLGFKSTQSGGVLLSSQEADGLELSLVDGFVEFKHSKDLVKSSKQYNNGHWHYLTAFRNSSRMELRVDNTDGGEAQSSPGEAKGNDTILGKETFEGCLRNLYLRRPEEKYMPADLNYFPRKGDVSLGVCSAGRPPQPLMSRKQPPQSVMGPKQPPRAEALMIRKQKRNRLEMQSVSRGEASQGGCKLPTALIQTYHLTGTNSHLSYRIAPEELNLRPHFSMDVRTRASEGLLLHIAGKNHVPLVALYMTKGKIKFSVGPSGSISYHKKTNDGDWHSIKCSVESNTFHLLVDGHRVTDGQLSKDEGVSLGLLSPVHLGGGHNLSSSGAQKSLPRKSVIGCIRDFKFNNVLVDEPAVSHRVAPCFDGKSERGAYFAGNGAHVVLEKFFTLSASFDLGFDVRPGNVTGLLFHVRGLHGHSLSVYMKKGKVVVQVNDAAGDYSASVTPQRSLCDGTFHRVTVSKQRNVIQLEVDSDSQRAAGPPHTSYPKARETLYIGGIAETQRKRTPVWSSFVGCLRDVRIDGDAVPFRSAPVSGVFGPVNLEGCPAN